MVLVLLTNLQIYKNVLLLYRDASTPRNILESINGMAIFVFTWRSSQVTQSWSGKMAIIRVAVAKCRQMCGGSRVLCVATGADLLLPVRTLDSGGTQEKHQHTLTKQFWHLKSMWNPIYKVGDKIQLCECMYIDEVGRTLLWYLLISDMYLSL